LNFWCGVWFLFNWESAQDFMKHCSAPTNDTCMTDREVLYQAILTHPDDDTLRLVYADALEEEGEEQRAAFIRMQVELTSRPVYDPACIRAQHEGINQMESSWLHQLHLPDGISWAEPAFRRGFPAAIRAEDVRTFTTHADDLFSRFPIECLELDVARLGEAHRFPECRWSSRLQRLAVIQGLSGPSAQRLLALPDTAQLRHLSIGAGLTTAATATAIVNSPPFKHLTALSYRDGRTTAELVAALTRLTAIPRLRFLDLAGNRLTNEQLTRLLSAPILADVESLDLSEDLGTGSTRVIARANLPKLRSLRLVRTRPGLDGVRSLAEADFFPELLSLSLAGNHLPDAVVAVLTSNTGMGKLRVLDLSENRLGDRGVGLIANGPQFQQLMHLDLRENLIEDEGANALADSPFFQNLVHLDLSGNPISSTVQDRLRDRFGDRLVL
jgi:uncharacterized protein (TIGR02996 family)